MARWLNRRRPGPVELPAWARDPRTDDEQAWAWAEAVYLDSDPDLWLEVFGALISIPRYGDGHHMTLPQDPDGGRGVGSAR